jgi:hypothetical protein
MFTALGERCIWRIPGMPHRGWTLLYVTELEEAEHTCEACGKTEIRFVHTIRHREFRDLDVGCCCCEHLTGDYVGPRRREAEVKAKVRREATWRRKWLEKPWRCSASGNLWQKIGGYHAVVFDRPRGGYGAQVNGEFSQNSYPTWEAAKDACFQQIQWLREQES